MHNMGGVIAPNLTPFNADLSPDVPLYVQHAKQLLAEGCAALAPFGTTGEALSLGMSERMTLLEAMIGSGIPPSQIIPGTGLTSLPDTLVLCRHAAALGCAGVMTLPPFYYKPVQDEGLYRYFANLIEGVADGRLRICLYHIPPVAQVGLSVSLVGRLQRNFPGIVVAIKDSGGDWANTERLLEEVPGIIVYPGSELQLTRSLTAGAPGCITATANVNARAIRTLYGAWDTPGATALEAEVDAYRKIIQPYGPIPAMKALLAYQYDHAPWASVRPPLMPTPPQEFERLNLELSQLQPNRSQHTP